MSIGGVVEETPSHVEEGSGRVLKRKRDGEEEEEDCGARKMSRCWSFASDLLRKGSLLTARVAMAVQDVVKAAFRFGDVAWSRPSISLCNDDDIVAHSFGNDDEIHSHGHGNDDDNAASGGDSETFDTDDAYERILSSSTIVRNVPTVDIGVAKHVETVSRSELRQQLLQRLSINTTARHVEKDNNNREVDHVKPFVKVKSRGVKMLDLIDRDVPRSPGPLDTGAVERGCCAHDDDDDTNIDTNKPDVGEDAIEKECVDAGSAEASLSSLRGSAAQEVSLVNMVQHGADADKSGDATSALSPQLCAIVEDMVLPPTTEDVFEGFNIPDVWVPNDDGAQHVEQGDKSPVSHTSIGIGNHNVDLSPEDVPCAENTASKASPPPVRVQSMRALLRKRWGKNGGAGKQREIENELFTKLRECVINTRLAKHYKLGEEWAKLNAAGVDLDMEVDLVQLEHEAVESVRREHGDEALETYMTDIEKDWEHIYAVRQKYHADQCHDDTGKTPGPPKSILKRDVSGRKSPPRLRWAEENIQHTYCENEYTEKYAPAKADQVQHSTRGLRMLLASSGAKYSQSCSGGVSPPCTEINQQISSDKHILRMNGRSRSRTISSVGKSQGQRLFQALQQAAPDPPTIMHHSMDVPKKLSTAMQVSEISPNRTQHDMYISSV
ncbi:hypothetical protein M9435_006506 [Picochlorum sp. BPE23]|nr:hypothetical protein M9435_006506 [Picochlorum sp. BPE23]